MSSEAASISSVLIRPSSKTQPSSAHLLTSASVASLELISRVPSSSSAGIPRAWCRPSVPTPLTGVATAPHPLVRTSSRAWRKLRQVPHRWLGTVTERRHLATTSASCGKPVRPGEPGLIELIVGGRPNQQSGWRHLLPGRIFAGAADIVAEPICRQGRDMPSGNGRSSNLVLAAMIFAVAMTFIDQTIVSIAVPTIQYELKLSSTGVPWVVNGYIIALAALFALGGRLSDIFGHRRMCTLGVIIFAGASAMCGLTPKGSVAEAWIVGFRVVQGAGGALMFPAAVAIVVNTFPLRPRGKALG